ncbi:membrane-bound alkaline phosphatase-like [Bacillus rossius redtenbacheri]|uniref:membrane-bound alkaline phosphatase-like n=1 Tax=Bacillus rossius redtenbacheri TaxID=93214 RepID=UPI002FDDD632
MKAQEKLLEHLKTFPNYNVAKNVIMFLGDGLSIPTISATRIYLGKKNGLQYGEEQELFFETFPYTGLSKTYCVDTQVADSACSATAYLCGVKANRGTMGLSASAPRKSCEAMNNASNHVESIFTWAQEAGKSTGLVTTTRVTHASPGGGYAHTAERYWECDENVLRDGLDPELCSDIAEQLVLARPGRDIQVILGGGRKMFRPVTSVDEEGDSGSRLDGVDLISRWHTDKLLRGARPHYAWNKEGLLKMDIENTDFLMGLFESDHLLYNLDTDATKEPSLPELTEVAIKMLQKNNKGYFLFVEGGRIDQAHHETRAQKALDETEQFQAAVRVAAQMTSEQDTLIVVTADHSHVMTHNGYPRRGRSVFETAGVSNRDGLPHSILSYANGPGYKRPTSNGSRYDISTDNMRDKDYRFPALAPLGSETHGGDDVPVFARGPWAQLFTGVLEQHVIPHAMAFAACLGDGLTACWARRHALRPEDLLHVPVAPWQWSPRAWATA